MTARVPKVDATLLEAALGHRAPEGLSREGRVRLLAEAFQALLDGKLPTRQAGVYLGGAGLAWLEQGGNLERDFLKVTKPKSHMTPARLWEQQRVQGAHPDEGIVRGDDEE